MLPSQSPHNPLTSWDWMTTLRLLLKAGEGGGLQATLPLLIQHVAPVDPIWPKIYSQAHKKPWAHHSTRTPFWLVSPLYSCSLTIKQWDCIPLRLPPSAHPRTYVAYHAQTEKQVPQISKGMEEICVPQALRTHGELKTPYCYSFCPP